MYFELKLTKRNNKPNQNGYNTLLFCVPDCIHPQCAHLQHLCFIPLPLSVTVMRLPSDEPTIVAEVATVRLEARAQQTVMEDAEMQMQEMREEPSKVVLSPPERNVEDDWFLLLDVLRRGTLYMPPGSSIYPSMNLFYLSVCLSGCLINQSSLLFSCCFTGTFRGTACLCG